MTSRTQRQRIRRGKDDEEESRSGDEEIRSNDEEGRSN